MYKYTSSLYVYVNVPQKVTYEFVYLLISKSVFYFLYFLY